MIKNASEMLTFMGGEFEHRLKVLLTLTPFAHFFEHCKNRWEVMRKQDIAKVAKMNGRGWKFNISEHRGVKNP